MADSFETHYALLRRLLPGESMEQLEVRQGQFHNMVLGSDKVVCLARTEAAATRLPQRAAVLRALNGLELGLRAPKVLATGGTFGSEEPAYLVMDRIPGAPLEPEHLNEPVAARAVAAQYAALLSNLRNASRNSRTREALAVESAGRWRAFAAAVRRELFPLMSAPGRARAEHDLAGLAELPHRTVAVVHGDLGSENVLWVHTEEGPHLSGVIDWDEVGIGDPAEDLAAVGASLGRQLLDQVIAAGGWASEPGLEERINAIAATFALQQALYAFRDGDEDELQDGLACYQ